MATILLVHTDVDPEHEEAFNRWYDETHVPDILSVEGFVAARRYKLAGPAPRNQQPASRYLAVYELDTDDTKAAMKRLGEENARFQERGRDFPRMQVHGVATYTALGERAETGR